MSVLALPPVHNIEFVAQLSGKRDLAYLTATLLQNDYSDVAGVHRYILPIEFYFREAGLLASRCNLAVYGIAGYEFRQEPGMGFSLLAPRQSCTGITPST